MSLLNQIYKETETRAAEHDQVICERILRELETIFGIPFVGFMGRGNVSMLLSFFKLEGNLLFRDTAYELMERYGVNKRALLFRLTSEIYPPDDFDEARILTNCLPLIKHPNHYELKTSFGTLTLYRLTDRIQVENVKCVLQRQDMHGKCHNVVGAAAPFFKEDLITTCKLPLLFGGEQYHSYITCQDGSGIMDFSRNTFFSGSCFEDVFEPEVVVQYRAKELEARFKDFEKDNPELVNGFYPVLQLALKEEVGRNGKSI